MGRIRRYEESDAERVSRLYAECFAEKPWEEKHVLANVIHMFEEIDAWGDSIIHVYEADGYIVGVSVGFDLTRKDDVLKLLPQDLCTGFYLSELFVDPRVRQQGIAHGLIRERFIVARQYGYQRAVVRTSIQQGIIISTYKKMGYAVVATQDVESTKIVDGRPSVVPDRRVILSGPIV